jgi:hypothetical protein
MKQQGTRKVADHHPPLKQRAEIKLIDHQCRDSVCDGLV